MPLARTWPELLSRHPVSSRAHQLHFVELEQQNLVRYLERAGTFSAAELAELRRPGPRNQMQLMGLSIRIAGLVDRIAGIESSFAPGRREEMLAGIFSFLTDAVGLPEESIRALFTDVRWETRGFAEAFAVGGLPAPVRPTRPEDVQTAQRRPLLALVAKRLTHDLLIHGHSLRFFYQALPLMRETIDRGNPGLTDLYIGFGASLQLMMLLYRGPYPGGEAIRAGRVEVSIRQESFRISVQGINFPSLFNEIVKGLYEALLHPGMPTAKELGADEGVFRELTSGPDLEYELMKVAPEASLRIHGALAGCHARDPQAVRRMLQRAGYDDIDPQGEVAMLYRAFARLSPARTALFACRSFAGPMDGPTGNRLAGELIGCMEEN